MDVWVVLVALVVAGVFGLICAAIAAQKNRSRLGYGLLGFFLPLIGLIVIAVLPKQE
jgi:hypothetical protein